MKIPIPALDRFLPEHAAPAELRRLLAMMALYFTVLFAVGILRPIRNSLALDGLAQSEFYKVYLVSALVVFFVPVFNRMAERIRWGRLIPGTAAFFALNLLMFRAFYAEGSAFLGMVFYGWYDLFAAALVTQFFMAVQIFFNSRDAKSAIPLVIAAGSLGATLGGLTTGAFATVVGTPNLLVVAALFVGVFAAALPFLWTRSAPPRRPGRRTEDEGASTLAEMVRVFSNRHIRVIAVLVLLTVVVKTMVDYEFNEAVAVHAGDRDAVTSFQGYVFGAINWMPIVVLLPLGPLLKRWGIGLAVLLLPVVMLGATTALVLAFSVWTATVAKAADATFRYSAERTGREILYVPVPMELKLKAKAYIDIAVEKGVGKALSGLLIFALLGFMDYRQVAVAALVLAAGWTIVAWRAHREYVSALAHSIRGRFASFEGGFASLSERSTLALVEGALRGEMVDVAFGLDLVEEAGAVDARPLADELDLLLDHPSADIRARVLRLLAHLPGLVEEARLRQRLHDPSPKVREEAVAALAAAHVSDPVDLAQELLSSGDRGMRHAALSWLVRGDGDAAGRASLGRAFLEERFPSATERSGPTAGDTASATDDREELALAVGLLDGDPRVPELLGPLLQDPDRRVAGAALRSAGVLRVDELNPRILSVLSDPALRGQAREALVAQGPRVVDLLGERMLDSETPVVVRRQIPATLARIPEQGAVRGLLAALSERAVDREVRYRALKALNNLRVRRETKLEFAAEAVVSLAVREVDEAGRLARIRSSLRRIGASGPGIELLARAVDEGWRDRQEATFRLLGLLFPPEEVYRAFVTITRGNERSRANAIEWLERTLGRELFVRVQPVVEGPEGDAATQRLPTLNGLLEELRTGTDSWLALLAAWNHNQRHRTRTDQRGDGMDLIEKVFLLQRVDLLQEARSSHLALLASIAEEVEVAPGEELLQRGEPNDCLYVLIRGEVELRGMGDQVLMARENTPFGTWALIDSDPSLVGARVEKPSRLLRITRSDFQDLLSDYPELAVGMLQGLARRVRSLVA